MESQKETVTIKWTEPLTSFFVSLLVEEMRKGNRTTTTYNKTGWNNIRVEFNKRTKLNLTLVQLKNKANKLRGQYSSFKKLLSQSGFGWDNVNKKVVVDDPTIWEAHIKENKDWGRFRHDGFPQYPDLCILFGDTYATGDYAAGNAEGLALSDGDDNGGGGGGGDDDNGGGGDDNGGSGAELPIPEEVNEEYIHEEFAPDVSSTPAREKHRLNRTPNSKRRRKSSTFDVSGTCKALQEMIKARMSQSTSGSVTSQVPSPVDPYSVAAVVGVLNDMSDLDQNIYNKAVNQACLNASWREAFMIALPERRRGLLEYL